MKILVLSREYPPYSMGGISYHLSHLYREIADNHEVEIVAGKCLDRKTDAIPASSPQAKFVEYGGLTGHHIRFSFALWKYLRTIQISKFDVAVTHTQLPFALPIPTVIKLHDCKAAYINLLREQNGLAHNIADRFYHPIRSQLESRALSVADAAIFNSDLCRSAWEQRAAIPDDSVVIHNGIDTNLFDYRPTDSLDELPEEYFLFVGTSKRKGLPEVLDFSEDSPLPIVIVGEINGIQAENVVTLGHINHEELPIVYSQATATIHPARFEAFGNVILESIACGTPVVISPKCGAAEVLRENNGVVCEDLDQGIDLILEGNYSDCGESVNELSWESIASKTEKYLMKVIGVQ
jgi:glycosyltransferase involved in cell wall biosynthesis